MTPRSTPKRRRPGTYERIWSVVRRIPPGRVATYGQVARAAGFPDQPRLAGYALHALPTGSPVPWHRVVNARGRISLSTLDGEYALQRAMLEAEGVEFAGERIDLARQGWKRGTRGRLVSPGSAAVTRAQPSPPALRAAPAGPRPAPAPRRRARRLGNR